METVRLRNGVTMPLEGFGVFQVAQDQCEEAVQMALQAGYRLIDTASSYQNEAAVGAAIRKSGIPRDEIFVTSKAYIQEMGYEKTKKAAERQLQKLGLEYLDLYLIHMPFGDYYGAYRAMLDLYQEGKIRAIGVSNFTSDRIIDLCKNFTVWPAVDQLELHPFYQRADELALLQEYQIQPQAWAPFAEGMNGMFSQPLLLEIARQHEKSVAQVILRWNIQRGVAVIPKSVHQNRIEENIDIWDFSLTAEEMQKISSLDLHKPQMLDPRDPQEVRRVYDFLEHPVLTTLHNAT